MTLELEQEFKMYAGNLDLLGGLSAQSETASQDKLLAGQANKLLDAMQRRVLAFTKQVVKSLAWYLWNDPFINMPLTRRVPGVRLYAPSLRHADLFSPGYAFFTTRTPDLLRWMASEARAAGASPFERDPVVIVGREHKPDERHVEDGCERDRLVQRDPLRPSLAGLEPGDRHPVDPHAGVAQLFRDWLAQGILERDAQPAIYFLSQRFRLKTGEEKIRQGFIALLELQDEWSWVQSNRPEGGGEWVWGAGVELPVSEVVSVTASYRQGRAAIRGMDTVTSRRVILGAQVRR